MIAPDFLEQYRENNRVEAKKAWGGLPKSIWETYSAFANTWGGVILLGVMENKEDKSLYAVGLPDPEGLKAEFLRLLPQQVSVNLLREEHVHLYTLDGKTILALEIPRAPRRLRPVYVGPDVHTGTYRRNGEGDYRCSAEEIQAMLRDQQNASDSRPLPLSMDALEESDTASFSARLQEKGLTLFDVCAASSDSNAAPHPTEAGLLFLGRFSAIQEAFPHFSLTLSLPSPEPFYGNLSAFWRYAAKRLTDYAASLDLPSSCREEFLGVILSALSNALAHSDYRLPGGIEIKLEKDALVFSNPGSFRLHPGEAFAAEARDPRNETLLRLFSLALPPAPSGGLSRMYSLFQRLSFAPPVLLESFEPAQTRVYLPLSKEASSLPCDQDCVFLRQAIGDYLLRYAHATESELSSLTGLPSPLLLPILEDMEKQNLLFRDLENPLLWKLSETAQTGRG